MKLAGSGIEKSDLEDTHTGYLTRNYPKATENAEHIVNLFKQLMIYRGKIKDLLGEVVKLTDEVHRELSRHGMPGSLTDYMSSGGYELVMMMNEGKINQEELRKFVLKFTVTEEPEIILKIFSAKMGRVIKELDVEFDELLKLYSDIERIRSKLLQEYPKLLEKLKKGIK